MPDIEFSTKGAEKIVEAQGKITRSLDLTKREIAELGRIENQVLRATETARERYIRKLDEARRVLAGNKIETEQLAKYEEKLAATFARTATDGEKAALKQKAAIGQVTKEEQKLLDALQKTEQHSKGIGESLATAFSPTKIAGAVSAVMGVQQAIGLVRAELAAAQKMVDDKNVTQLTVGQSRNVLLRNLVGSSPDEIQSVQKAATDIAADTGVSEVPINAALAAAISATGGKNKLAVSLVRQSAKFLKDRPDEIGDFAGSLGDLTRVTGSDDPMVSMGLLAKTGQLSRITSPKLLAASAAPALIGATAFGGDARTGASLFAALTSGSGDFTGASTGTALIALASQLDDASKGKGSFEKLFKPGEIAGNTLLDRIRALQNNPELAQRFIDKASFEKKAQGPMQQLLLDPRSAVRADFENALKQVPDNSGLAKVGQEAVDIFRFNTLENMAGRSRNLKSGVERLQTNRPSDRLSSDDLEQIKTSLLETGSTAAGAQLTEIIGRIKGGGTVPATEATNIIRGRLQQLEHPLQSVDYGGLGDHQALVPREQTGEEKEQAAILRKMLEQLEKQTDALGKIKNSDGGMIAGGE